MRFLISAYSEKGLPLDAAAIEWLILKHNQNKTNLIVKSLFHNSVYFEILNHKNNQGLTVEILKSLFSYVCLFLRQCDVY